MLSPFATARCNTSSVAIIVTATPVTGVDGSPVLNVSTVFSLHSTPTCDLIASTTSCAVTFLALSRADADPLIIPIPTTTTTPIHRLIDQSPQLLWSAALPRRFLISDTTTQTPPRPTPPGAAPSV